MRDVDPEEQEEDSSHKERGITEGAAPRSSYSDLISLLMGHQIDGCVGIPCQNLIHFHLEDTVMT